MECRNADLVEYSPLLTRLLNCNSAPLLLGAGQTAKGAGMYMTKYMTKETFAIAAALSVLIDARKHIDEYPSCAEDSGAATRTGKHFLQRVLTSATRELAPTQAAALALNIPSADHSHSFVNAYVWDAVRLTQVLQNGGRLLSDHLPTHAECKETLPQKAEKANTTNDTDDEHGQDEDSDDGEDAEDPSEKLSAGRYGVAAIYKNADGDNVAAAQAEHYAYRDHALKDISLDEFIMSMHLDKKPKDVEDAPPEFRQGAGRPRTPTYSLLPPHPLFECYVIKEKYKYDVPILVGDPPPRAPVHRSGQKLSNSKQRKIIEHARYFATLFIPWCADGPVIDTSPAAWNHFMDGLAFSAALPTNGTTASNFSEEDRLIAEGRLWRIEQVGNALLMNTSRAKLMSLWRSRNRKMWDVSGTTPC